MLDTVLLFAAIACFVVAAFGDDDIKGVGLVPLGLALFVVTFLTP